MTDRELLARIACAVGQKAGYKQLVRELGLGGGRERRLLLEQLGRLTVRGQLMKLDREFWGIPRAASRAEGLIAGRLDLHRDGYGFVRPLGKPGGKANNEDIFIPPDALNGAMQGDQVLVDAEPARADGRRQGRIARIVERKNPTVVGVFRYGRTDRQPVNVVIPFDERMSQRIVIPDGDEIVVADEAQQANRVLGERTGRAEVDYADLSGLVVDVEIVSWPTPTRPPVGRVIEVLGHPDDFGVDVEMMIRKHRLPHVFPENVLAEAERVAHLDEEILAERRDFRGLPIVTIDGETAKDFDDAVLVTERRGGGYELQVHIADVAAYVTEGSDLDLEARLRGTSVYFPDRAIPMLPRELSTGICSLKPEEDRLVLSCLMQLDAGGRIESYEVVEGVIRSAARMTYTEVHAILEGDKETREKYAPLVESFERMHRLAQLMNKRRDQRGSIDFDLPEPVIEFDERGQMKGVTKAERSWANRLIEEFMLAANECVATWLEDLGVPSLYRIHERPEPRKVVQFEELAAAFGYSLGLGPLPVKKFVTRGDRRNSQRTGNRAREVEAPEEIAVTPRMYQKLAAKIEGKPEERIVSYLMLRSLQQARYSERNEGHFALAAPTYTHFTSPIRRYPDLIVHRIAKALLAAGVPAKAELVEGRQASPWTHINEGSTGTESRAPHLTGAAARRMGRQNGIKPPVDEQDLAQIGIETSQSERRAAEAERELMEWKKVRFMRDRVGEEFAGLVLNPTKYGLFVELTDLFVEGLVPIDALGGDYYEWRDQAHEVVGVRTGRRFRAGDRVQVVLDKILTLERKLQFSIVEEGLPLGAKKAAKEPGSQAKPVTAAAKAKKARKKELAAAPTAKAKFKPKKHTARKGRRK